VVPVARTKQTSLRLRRRQDEAGKSA